MGDNENTATIEDPKSIESTGSGNEQNSNGNEDQKTIDNRIPYDRFKKVNDDLKTAKAELEKHQKEKADLAKKQLEDQGKYQEADRAIVQDWLSQMVAGYKAAYPLSSFNAQLRVYQSKIGKAEADLKKMIFYGDQKS